MSTESSGRTWHLWIPWGSSLLSLFKNSATFLFLSSSYTSSLHTMHGNSLVSSTSRNWAVGFTFSTQPSAAFISASSSSFRFGWSCRLETLKVGPLIAITLTMVRFRSSCCTLLIILLSSNKDKQLPIDVAKEQSHRSLHLIASYRSPLPSFSWGDLSWGDTPIPPLLGHLTGQVLL